MEVLLFTSCVSLANLGTWPGDLKWVICQTSHKMDNQIDTSIYLEVTKKTGKHLGCAILETLDYTDYEALHNSVKKFIAAYKNVDERDVSITSMIYYPGRRAIVIRRTSDVLQARCIKEPKLGLMFGNYIMEHRLSYNFQSIGYSGPCVLQPSVIRPHCYNVTTILPLANSISVFQKLHHHM